MCYVDGTRRLIDSLIGCRRWMGLRESRLGSPICLCSTLVGSWRSSVKSRERQVLAAEASEKAAAEVITSSSFGSAAVTPSKFAEESNDEQSQTENSSKGSRSKRRRQTRESENVGDWESPQVRSMKKGYKSKAWEARKAAKEEQHKVRIVSHNSQKRQGYYAKLRKSLYGLRRAAKLFNRGLRELLQANGYESCPADVCIFRKVSGTESILFNAYSCR